MSIDRILKRTEIIQPLIHNLKPLSYIHSFYEGGAAAFRRIDKWSDIDLYLIVDDDKIEETFLAFEKTLESLSPIKQKYEVKHPESTGLYQSFYKLEYADDYHMIDLAVMKMSSSEKFLEPEIHGDVVFYFNKLNEIKPSPLKKNEFIIKATKRLNRIQENFNMFNNLVQKEINRGNHLEAIDLYHNLTLGALVEVLRMKHNPVHHGFKMRYIHYELPSKSIKKLKSLYFVKDETELQKKYSKAIKWFTELISEIDETKIRKNMQISSS
ncbi:MAG: aminoglycoside 6-adenylyltransferase [Candidatus Bathyarchaeota archaeon]|jgi:hypothetical protein